MTTQEFLSYMNSGKEVKAGSDIIPLANLREKGIIGYNCFRWCFGGRDRAFKTH